MKLARVMKLARLLDDPSFPARLASPLGHVPYASQPHPSGTQGVRERRDGHMIGPSILLSRNETRDVRSLRRGVHTPAHKAVTQRDKAVRSFAFTSTGKSKQVYLRCGTEAIVWSPDFLLLPCEERVRNGTILIR